MNNQIINTVLNKIWTFGNINNKYAPYGHMAFHNGIICGYQNPNETFYEFTPDSLIIFTKDKKQSSIFLFSDYNEEQWVGNCMIDQTASTKHFLSIATNNPIPIQWNDQFANIAKKNKFYFSFLRTEGVYDQHATITAYPNANVEPGATLPIGSLISIGRFSYVSAHSTINLRIGRYSSIGAGIRTFGNSHPINWLTSNPILYAPYHQHLYKDTTGFDLKTDLMFEQNPNFEPIYIGHDVWIGEECILKPGITIGDGAVIGARSIVTKDIPPYAIAAGSPATVKKFRFDQKTINKLLHLQWWNYHLHELNISWDNPSKAVNELELQLNSPSIQELQVSNKDYCLEFIRLNTSVYA